MSSFEKSDAVDMFGADVVAAAEASCRAIGRALWHGLDLAEQRQFLVEAIRTREIAAADIAQAMRKFDFATELTSDAWYLAHLWTPDGCHASSICIRKEILKNVDEEFPVFHLYNFFDPSKAHCRNKDSSVNAPEEPFLKFVDALALAEQHLAAALRSRQWVRVEDLRPSRQP